MEWITRTYRMSFHASICAPDGKKMTAVLLCFAVWGVAGATCRLYIHPRVHHYMPESNGDLGEGPLFGRGVWTATHDNCDERSGHGPLQQRLIPTGMLKHDTWRMRSG